MLRQNIKGLLTLVFIFTLLVGGFYLYKTVFEPSLVKNSIDQLPLTTDVEVSPQITVYENSAQVVWETPFEANGGVMYCEKENPKVCNEINSDKKLLSQKITLQNLTPETKYNYKILVDGQYFPTEENNFFEFSTKPQSKTNNQKSTLNRTTPTVQINNTTTIKAKNLLEFRQAQEKQDLKYDTNGDGKIDISDYQP